MSASDTAVATTEQQSSANVSFDLQTYVVLNEGTEKEPVYKAYPEDEAQKRIDEKKGTEVFRQSGRFYKASNEAGANELIPDEKERTQMFNRGIMVKQQNRFRAKLVETDEDGNIVFQGSDGAYDLREIVASPTQRRGLTPLEKLERVLEGLPKEVRQAYAAQLAAKQQEDGD